MIEKPNLADDAIITALKSSYGLLVNNLEFLQLGNDANAWVYKVHVDGGQKNYFLKVRKGEINKPSLIVPRYLKDHNIEQVVAPIANQQDQLWTGLDNFALILYPFVEGTMGAKVGMSDAYWIELGAIVRQIHDLPLSADLDQQMDHETFISHWMDTVQAFQADITQRSYRDEYEKEFLTIWIEKRSEIQRVIDRTLQLGHLLQKQSLPFVLCHADIHTYNVLITPDNKLFIVDWDETEIAPKEQDLMFVGGGINDRANRTKEVEMFYRGYGETEINPVAFAYYRYEWVVQELGSYANLVFLTADVGELTKKEAVYYYRNIFQPGDTMETAFQTEANLPPELQYR